GKNKGVHFGLVSVRSSGSFLLVNGKKRWDGVNAKYCVLAQKATGYSFLLATHWGQYEQKICRLRFLPIP
ncbi:MAG: hypothetical protein AAF443_06550, partial [Chlamydiota bacterium]